MSKQSVRYTIHFLTAVSITAMVLFVIYGMQNPSLGFSTILFWTFFHIASH